MKEGREIFKVTGEPEDTSKIKEHDAWARFREGKKDSRLREFLDTIDFELLRSLFLEAARKSGVNPETLNFVSADGIFGKSGSLLEPLGAYSGSRNIVALSMRKMEDRFGVEGKDLDTVALSTLCHEEVHATAKTICIGLGSEAEQAGYQRTMESATGRLEKRFLLFNEGVTEKLCRQILEEYVERTHFADSQGMNRLRDLFREKHPYESLVEFVDLFIDRVSAETEVSRDLVWQAIIRGAYEGERFDDPELQQLFSELLTPDFIELLSQNKISDLRGKLTKSREKTPTNSFKTNGMNAPRRENEGRLRKWLKTLLPTSL